MKLLQDFVFKLHKLWIDLVFLFNKVLQTLCNPRFGEKFQFFLVKFSSFIERLTSLFSLYNICSQFIWLKSYINLLLSNFFQSRLRVSPNHVFLLDFDTGNVEKKSGKKNKLWKIVWVCRYVTLPDLIFSKEFRFEQILLINL